MIYIKKDIKFTKFIGEPNKKLYVPNIVIGKNDDFDNTYIAIKEFEYDNKHINLNSITVDNIFDYGHIIMKEAFGLVNKRYPKHMIIASFNDIGYMCYVRVISDDMYVRDQRFDQKQYDLYYYNNIHYKNHFCDDLIEYINSLNEYIFGDFDDCENAIECFNYITKLDDATLDSIKDFARVCPWLNNNHGQINDDLKLEG